MYMNQAQQTSAKCNENKAIHVYFRTYKVIWNYINLTSATKSPENFLVQKQKKTQQKLEYGMGWEGEFG